ncbi:MAG: hypothetical protein NTZ59_11745 [Bacteroidetes bacterium]|nr:hypothetical protein [Bacteroidota bacterium]
MKTTIKNLVSLFLIAIMSIVLSNITGFEPMPIAGVLLVAGVAVYVTRVKNQSNVMFEGLAAEVWIPMVKEDFYPKNSFLNGAMDLSSLVNNDKINFAEAGADPTVLKNNTTYPINVVKAADTPKAITLDYYDTESTWVENATAIEQAYDQKVLYTNKHKKALLKKLGMDAAYAYAPTQDDSATKNKVIALGSGSIIDAIIDLRAFYDGVDDDGSERHLVLDPSHLAMISKEDKVLYKAMLAEEGATFFGFKMWNYSKNPIYVTSTGVKAAAGAAYVSGTHNKSSFSFLGSEVMKAIGTMEMFSKLKDPDYKGDIFNFQMRALVGRVRAKYAGAILK